MLPISSAGDTHAFDFRFCLMYDAKVGGFGYVYKIYASM